MIWPAQSPDLNPIEQVWDLLATKVHKMNSRLTAKNMMANLTEAWNSITKEVLRSYIDTMQARCQAVIKAKGGHTRY
jgi:hypothetical protein